MEEWKEYKLGDICNISSSKRIFAEEYVSSGIPFYRGKEIIEKHNKNTVSSELFITHERFAEIKSKFPVPQIDDILLTSVGTLGIPWLVNESNFYFKDGNLTWFRSNTEKVNPKFLYYWFESNYAKNQIDSMCIGSTQKALTIDTLSKFSINLPPLPTQQKIAAILSSLDAKIELNNKINTNLEQQAGALFKNWFVDFEPFGGKMPEGWKEKTLDSFCSIFTGRKNANASVENGKYKFFTCSPNVLPIDSFIFDGDAIIISGNGAYTGRTRFYSGKFDLYQRTYACTMKKDQNQDYIFILYWIIKFVLSKKIMGGTHGSAIPYIVMDDIAKFVINYDKKLFDDLSKIMKSYVLQIQENENQNEKLAELRDTLLPKLMNGEINI